MKRAPWGVILRAAAYVLVIGFLGYQLWRARAGIAPSLRTVGWGSAALATVLAAVGGVPGFIGWPLLSAIQVFFAAGLTRSLPGGIWPALAHAVQARPLGQSPARMGAAYLGSQVIGVLAGPAVGLLALPWLVAANPLWWALPAVALVALVPMAVPNLLDRLLALARRVFRREGEPVPLPSRGRLFGITGFVMGGWTISGLHVAVLAIALGASPVAALTVGVGGFSLAVVAGIAALFLPAGLGVRELVLGLTLATVVTGPGLITIVALSRVLITVADLLSTAVALGLLTISSRALTPVKVTL
jgi:hypothetical protein